MAAPRRPQQRSLRLGLILLAALSGGCQRTAATPDAGCPDGRAPHDHRSLHGGQVGMVGELHLEVSSVNGRLRVYLSDLCRAPLPSPPGGTLVIEGEAGAAEPVERPLRSVGGAYLEGEDAAIAKPYLATVKATFGGVPVELSFLFAEADAGRSP